MGTNILHEGMSKASGTAKVLDWLNKHGIKPELFSVFGDSTSDLDIGKELLRQNLNFRFVFVGEKVPDNVPFEVIQPSEKFDKGTLEYLNSLK